MECRPATPAIGSRRATAMLVLVTLLWGSSFPLAKDWLNETRDGADPGRSLVAGLILIALRCFLALALLAVLRPGLFFRPSRAEFRAGAVVGAANFVGFALQVWGLATCSPAMSAVFTSLACAWVPVLAWACLRHAVAPLTWLGWCLGIAGTAVLTHPDSLASWQFGRGEALTLASTLPFAVAVLLLDRLGRGAPPGHLTVGFVAAMGVGGAAGALAATALRGDTAAWLAWTTATLRQPVMLRDLVLLTIFPTVLAFHWMVVYQPCVPAGRAALVYLLEPVFATALSVLAGLDDLTPWLVAGGGLVVGGNLLVELPGWLRERRSRAP